MICQHCANPATVHLTDIINKKKQELHLCESCAQKMNLLPGPEQEFNIPALLNFLIGKGQPTPTVGADSVFGKITCSECGATYAQFRAEGRLGCPHDYEAFRIALEPLLEKIHRSLKHRGKTPSRFKMAETERRVARLREDMAVAVREERYEDAARIRDEIRELTAPKLS